MAFSVPGRTPVQVAEMPDGKRYFRVLRTITRGGCRRHVPRAEFAVVALGCRICERRDCEQRARRGG